MDNKHYDWRKTFSYNAILSFIITARGRGKTFGMRKQFVEDYLKNGWRFVEITRYTNEIDDVKEEYFEKLQYKGFFKDYVFKTQGRYAFIAKKPKKGRKIKQDDWEVIGYFMSLNEATKMKKKTFINVKRIFMDEAILEQQDRYHNYLPDEYNLLIRLVDTILREEPKIENIEKEDISEIGNELLKDLKIPEKIRKVKTGEGRIYLCGNAVDMLNPYFRMLGIKRPPKYNYNWYRNKTVLLHYEKPDTEWIEQRKKTVVGLLSTKSEIETNFDNKFYTGNNEFIANKTRNSQFKFGLVYKGSEYGIWIDYSDGIVYINNKIVKNTNRPIYSLTLKDNSINYIMANNSMNNLKTLKELYQTGLVRFTDEGVMVNFMEILTVLGLKKV